MAVAYYKRYVGIQLCDTNSKIYANMKWNPASDAFSKEVGIGLVGFGILFSFLGVILFFDRGLLALGNIFFLAGVGLLLGWQSMWQLFTKKANLKGSIPFFIGLFLLFVRWPVAGIIMELYGSFVLFSGYGPPIQAFLYQIPVIGWVLQYPFQLFGMLRRKRA